MQVYKAPIRDMRFALGEMNDMAEFAELGFEDVDADLVETIFEQAATFCEGVLLPLNASGDLEGCHYDNGNRADAERVPRRLHAILRQRLAPVVRRSGPWRAGSATEPRQDGR